MVYPDLDIGRRGIDRSSHQLEDDLQPTTAQHEDRVSLDFDFDFYDRDGGFGGFVRSHPEIERKGGEEEEEEEETMKKKKKKKHVPIIITTYEEAEKEFLLQDAATAALPPLARLDAYIHLVRTYDEALEKAYAAFTQRRMRQERQRRLAFVAKGREVVLSSSRGRKLLAQRTQKRNGDGDGDGDGEGEGEGEGEREGAMNDEEGGMNEGEGRWWSSSSSSSCRWGDVVRSNVLEQEEGLREAWRACRENVEGSRPRELWDVVVVGERGGGEKEKDHEKDGRPNPTLAPEGRRKRARRH